MKAGPDLISILPDGPVPDGKCIRSCRQGKAASSLLVVMVVLGLILVGMSTYLSCLSGVRKIEEQRITGDRALFAAEAGLAQGVSFLNALSLTGSYNLQYSLQNPNPTILSSTFSVISGSNVIVTNTGTLFSATSVDLTGTMPQYFSPMETVSVMVSPTTANNIKLYTVISTATYTGSSGIYSSIIPLARRVQVSLWEPNFAQYESFIDNYGAVYSSKGYYFEGFNSVFLGPYHVNTGIAFWPNIWFLNGVTSGASGVNVYAGTSTYNSAVSGNPTAAANAVNILNYYSSTYNNPPWFGAGGLSVNSQLKIPLPTDLNTDTRSSMLKNSAGLKLSAISNSSYPSYISTAGSNFAVAVSGSLVIVQQYLGLTGTLPKFGPAVPFHIDGTSPVYVSGTSIAVSGTTLVLSGTTSIRSINNSLIVYGNIVSLQGTLSGSLTVAAFATGTSTGNPASPGGNINIDGNLQYASLLSGSAFQYGETTSTLIHSGTINTTVANQLESQLSSITDILGIIAEGSATIPQKNLFGQPIATGTGAPMNIDAIIMATGGSTPNSITAGSFAAENYTTRTLGAANFLGGAIQANYGQWAVWDGSKFSKGIIENRLWDSRPYTNPQRYTPPFFPVTGELVAWPNSWKSTFLSGTNAPDTPP